MEIYRTLNAMDVIDETILDELINKISGGCEKVIVDGTDDDAIFTAYCIGNKTVKEYRLDIDEEETSLKGEYPITERTDSRIVAGPVIVEKVSRYSNVWHVNGSYFGDVDSEDNFKNYDKRFIEWFTKKMKEFLKTFDDVGLKASFFFSTIAIDYAGIIEEAGDIDVTVDLCGKKIDFDVFSDGELIDGKIEIPLPDGSSMPVGILPDVEFWRGVKKLLCG